MSAEVASAARQAVAVLDRVAAVDDVKKRVELLWEYIEHERRFALEVAKAAVASLPKESRLAVLRLLSAARLFEMSHGEPVTHALLAALVAGADAGSDLTFVGADSEARQSR